MSILLNTLRLALAGCMAASLTACIVEHDHDDRAYPDETSSSGGGGTATPAPSSSGSGGATPILVTVDTGKTMSADPGQGVGVFVEYAAGGHWHAWWTCDTTKTSQPCNFDVTAQPASGELTNAKPDGLATSDTLAASSASIEVKSTTTTGVQGVWFDSDPGAVVTFTSRIDGVADPAFFFFVQDGNVNGGYAGKLTNPLKFQGSSP